MPFRSEKQRRYLWKNHPKIARDWTDTYGSKPVKKKEGGTPGYIPFYRTAQKIDKAIENWPEERKRLKKNFKTNVKNLLNKIKAEGKRQKEIRDKGLSVSEILRIYSNKPVKKKDGGLPKLDKYYGSYIKGTVDGHELSNPTYRKYYKGLI